MVSQNKWYSLIPHQLNMERLRKLLFVSPDFLKLGFKFSDLFSKPRHLLKRLLYESFYIVVIELSAKAYE